MEVKELQTHDVDNIESNLHRWTIISPFIVWWCGGFHDAAKQKRTTSNAKCNSIRWVEIDELWSVCLKFFGKLYHVFAFHLVVLARFMPRRMKPIILITEQLCRTRIYNDRQRSEVEKIFSNDSSTLPLFFFINFNSMKTILKFSWTEKFLRRKDEL